MSINELKPQDISILRLLQQNCKISAKEIARKTGIPVSTVYSRIKRIEDLGIVTSYKAVLSAEKIGRKMTAFILGLLSFESPSSKRRILTRVSEFPEVQEVHLMSSGNWDMLVKVKVKDLGDLRNSVNKLREVQGIVKVISHIVLETAKETLDVSL